MADVLVLARRDSREAIRVAAGLTIRGNTVRFVMMCEPVLNPHGQIANGEMFELAEIVPLTTLESLAGKMAQIDAARLGDEILKSDRVVSF